MQVGPDSPTHHRRAVVGRLRFPRWVAVALIAMFAICAMPAAANAAAPGKSGAKGKAAQGPRSTYAITRAYAIRNYPRHQSWFVQNYAPTNRFTAAITGQAGLVNTQFRLVDAINVDTVYGATLNMDLLDGPVILTMPGYTHVASLLTLNAFGDLFQTGIVPNGEGHLRPGPARMAGDAAGGRQGGSGARHAVDVDHPGGQVHEGRRERRG